MLPFVLSFRAHEVDQAYAGERHGIEEHHHRKGHGKAGSGQGEGIGREEEMESVDLGCEHAGGHEEQDLGEEGADKQADAERDKGDHQRLERKDRVHLAGTHAEDLVEAELLLPPAHQEVVGIDHEEAHDEGKEDGEAFQHVAEALQETCGIALEEIGLDRDRIEGVEDSNAERKGQKIHGIVVHHLAHVTEGKLNEHLRRLPRQRRSA